MSGKVFIDTNIWVYAKIEGNNSSKLKQAKYFLKNLSDQVIVSTQVINEYYNAIIKNRIEDIAIQDSIEQLLPNVDLQKISISTIRKNWDIKLKYKFSIYDSLIIASALEADCKILYTEDLQHNQLIEDRMQIINPFI